MAVRTGDGSDLSASGFNGTDAAEIATIINTLEIVSITGFRNQIPVISSRYLLEAIAQEDFRIPTLQRAAIDSTLTEFEVVHVFNPAIAYGRVVGRRGGTFTLSYPGVNTTSGAAFVFDTRTAALSSIEAMLGIMRIQWEDRVVVV